jgi:hypothetical protein
VGGMSRLAQWAWVAAAIIGLVIGASGCSREAQSNSTRPVLSFHESASHVAEQAASIRLARSVARMKTLRESWMASRQPMDDVLLHGVAEVEFRLDATSQALAFLQQTGGEDLDEMRQALIPALDDVDARIDRLRRATHMPLAAIADSTTRIRRTAEAPASLAP